MESYSLIMANCLVLKKLTTNRYIIDCGNLEHPDRNNPIPVLSDKELIVNQKYVIIAKPFNGKLIVQILHAYKSKYKTLVSAFIFTAQYLNNILQINNQNIRVNSKQKLSKGLKTYVGYINSIYQDKDKSYYEPHFYITGTIHENATDFITKS